MTREIGVLVAAAVALTGLELWLPATWHVPPGVTALFALVGCVAIVIASKALGKRWLQRAEGADE